MKKVKLYFMDVPHNTADSTSRVLKRILQSHADFSLLVDSASFEVQNPKQPAAPEPRQPELAKKQESPSLRLLRKLLAFLPASWQKPAPPPREDEPKAPVLEPVRYLLAQPPFAHFYLQNEVTIECTTLNIGPLPASSLELGNHLFPKPEPAEDEEQSDKNEQASEVDQNEETDADPFPRELKPTELNHLVIVMDDDFLTKKTKKGRGEYRSTLHKRVSEVLQKTKNFCWIESVHFIFLGTTISPRRFEELRQIPVLKIDQPKRYQRALRQLGLKDLRDFDLVLYHLFHDYVSSKKMTCSFIYKEIAYSANRIEFATAAMNQLLVRVDLLSDSSTYLSAFLRELQAFTIRSNYFADLQITVLGEEKKSAMFSTMSRNLHERWPVRYAHLKTKKIAYEVDNDTATQLLKVSPEANVDEPTLIHFSEVNPDKSQDDLNSFYIGSFRMQARQDMFIWIVPNQWFNPIYDDNVVDSPINKDLVTISQIIRALDASADHRPPILHVMEIQERESQFKVRPWVAFNPANDPIAAQAVRRRVPQIYHQLDSMVDDLRFHILPWSSNGSHFDYAPRWIDVMIDDALQNKLTLTGIGQ